MSNFVADPLNVLGWDPHEQLVDFLETGDERQGGGMRFGYWMPVFGGWLRNIPDEGMEASWDYVQPPDPAQRADRLGPDPDRRTEPQRHQGRGPAGARRLVDRRGARRSDSTIELMVAVRPNFHQPALFAKQRPTSTTSRGGRLALNVVSSWWADEATQYGLQFDQHDDRYARTTEWLRGRRRPVDADRFTFDGERYQLKTRSASPSRCASRAPIYAGGECEAAKTLIATLCDAYVMHGDPVEAIGRRSPTWRSAAPRPARPPMHYGMAAFAIVRDSEAEAQAGAGTHHPVPPKPPKGFDNFDQWLSGTQLERELKLQEYSVSNRGLRPNFVGTPEQVQRADRRL